MSTKIIIILFMLLSLGQTWAMDSYDIFKKWQHSLIYGSEAWDKNTPLSGVAWKYRKEIRKLPGEELANLLFLIDLTFPNISHAADASEAYGYIVSIAKRENVMVAQRLLTSIPYSYMNDVYGYDRKKYDDFIKHYNHLVELHDNLQPAHY